MMITLVTYDINTVSDAGKKRLRKIARVCEAAGYRVQSSVFEVPGDIREIEALKEELLRLIDPEEDSVRFYRLGHSPERKAEIIGNGAAGAAEGLQMII